MAKIDFNDLPTRTEIRGNDTLFMIIFQKTNGMNVSFKIPLKIFEKFYINSNILQRMRTSMEVFKGNIDKLIATMPSKDHIDTTYMMKKDSNYYRSRLLTEERLLNLLGEYCTKEKVDIDIQNCMEHSRSVANSLGNNLANIAVTAKSTNAIKSNNDTNTADMIEAISQATSGDQQSGNDSNSNSGD